jgi:hypothetical protein
MMLFSSAWHQLGKVVNPESGKAAVNLEAAQFTIDMIEGLKAKTRGNLDRDEEKMLSDLLSSLQMNYVEVARSAPSGQEPTTAEPGSEGPADKDSDQPDKSAKPDGKSSKYHKAYG